MSNDKVIKVNYFNVNNQKNSILENAKFQDNNLSKDLKKIENLTEEIKKDLSKEETKNNLIQFKKK
ncbi:MAG: hypothetical protein PHY80_02445 [Rickettsiales bacterium]|nr:hypothetical protein [Rickettsiales bacterium]